VFTYDLFSTPSITDLRTKDRTTVMNIVIASRKRSSCGVAIFNTPKSQC
jgi:hypothetical protein